MSLCDTERKEDEATLTDSESDDGDCVVMREVVTRNPLDPEAGECVPAALDQASEETSGYMDTPENTFEMEFVDEERYKKTEVSDEESDEGEFDEDRNRECERSDAQFGESELGENAEIRETADRPPSRVRLPPPAACNRPKRETRKPARYTDIAQQVLTPTLALSVFNQGLL